MITYTATYSPEDNKLRLYASQRLDKETYDEARAHGFRWAPKQDLFVAPMWTPAREDFLLSLCDTIDDEDTSLVERAEQRAERFEEYSDKRAADAQQAKAGVDSIVEHIPLGQPILVGHHSERRARKDAERIESGMRKAIKMWDTSEYWTRRAAGAIRTAKYKERPDVRARRIKKLESAERKQQKNVKTCETESAAWQKVQTREEALHVANYSQSHLSFCFPLDKYPRPEPASQYEGSMSLWSALGGSDGEDHAILRWEQAQALAVDTLRKIAALAGRWLAHDQNRLTYERAMYADGEQIASDKTKPEKGGACRCWASPRARAGGWSYIAKVNRVSVTIYDNWGRGGDNFTRTIKFDDLTALMTKAEVEEAGRTGRLVNTEDKTGFVLRDSAAPKAEKKEETPDKPTAKQEQAELFDSIKETLRAGIKTVSAPDLFQTPVDLAGRMVDLADIQPGHRVLEPSAGTGRLLGAMGRMMFGHNPECGELMVVEINLDLADIIRAQFPLTAVQCCDFLQQNGNLGTFDRILMNPPFSKGADIKHIQHALSMLRPGGRLVALCANGPRQERAFKDAADRWEPLPAGTFKSEGTNVNAALMVLSK
ncbi:MAG: DUF3560 domain-containing protein [Planctomycetota bacterium]|jgi:protein-L-isoaspartate O-methyltransferase